jgi:redox-sensitive bicupin YhaK (pirin superfamily)
MESDGPHKKLRCIQRSADRHWVGDGFPVRTLFAYSNLGSVLDPFLLLDHAGPHEFPPTEERLGVGEHPHRGFETVTIVYSGEVEHRDSSGGGGKIGPGDVQWMTAAGGIVHEEFHGRDYAKRGGPFEMVQLWVNLPARDKMAPPRYQGIRDAEIPALELPGATVRIIAGAFENKQGPAQTFSPIEVWDLRLSNAPLELPLRDGHTTALVVLHGSVRPEGCETVREGEVALFDRAGSSIRLAEVGNATALLLSGKPLGEPIVGHGPFVMNTEDEIRQAIKDYQSGRMGHLR